MPTPGVAARQTPPRPPERGSFPLDRLGECKEFADAYRKCIQASRKGVVKEECRLLSKQYLECRMERGLMAKEDMKDLGFRNEEGDHKE